jgi:hypothetical protein
MADTAGTVPPQPSSIPEGVGAAGDGSDLSTWANIMQAYAGAQGKGQPALSAGQFVAGTMPLMPLGGFAQVRLPRAGAGDAGRPLCLLLAHRLLCPLLQPFMYPAPLFYGGMPALHPAYTALAVGADGDAKLPNGEVEGGSQVSHSPLAGAATGRAVPQLGGLAGGPPMWRGTLESGVLSAGPRHAGRP